MILPDKYIKPSDSIFYLSALVLKKMNNKKIDLIDLWLSVKKEYGEKITYNMYSHILIYLYLIGNINFTKEGEIFNENIES